MRIAFDYQIFALEAYGGISRYFNRLVEQLLLQENEVKIFSPLHRNNYISKLPSGVVQGYHLERFPPKTGRLIMAYNRVASRYPIRAWQPHLLHETYYAFHSAAPDHCPTVVTVYDMIHELFAEGFPAHDQTSKLKKMSVDRSEYVICISESTRKDLIRLFGTPEEKISVVHLGFEKFTHPDSKFLPEEPLSSRPYLLYVGSRSIYKNFNMMLKVIAASPRLRKDFNVVAFGGGRFSAAERELIASLRFDDQQVCQVSGSDDVLGRLYEHAFAFIYPSLYEGFGLPPLEAMAHRCPVISSNTSSMPEVIGDAAEYFTPSDMDDIRRAIEAVAYSGELRAKLVSSGTERLAHFSWEKCAQETLSIYHRLVG